ncbi:putative chitin deacetylase [Rhodotorula toruloides]
MSATQLSLPSTIASSASLASLFSLQPSWSSSDPPSTAATADPSLVQSLLSSSWALTSSSTATSSISGLANLAWVPDPFDSSNSKAVLRLAYPEGSRDGAQFSFAAFQKNARVAFDSSFDFVKGGKLPGLYGSSPSAKGLCTGGNHLHDCWSARLMWRTGGAGEDYGTSLSRGSFKFARGDWTTIHQLISLSTPPLANGLLALYSNSSLSLLHTGIAYRTNPNVSITNVLFSSFFGGSDASWDSKGGNAYYRRVELYASTLPSNTTGPTVSASFDNTISSSSAASSRASMLRVMVLLMVWTMLGQVVGMGEALYGGSVASLLESNGGRGTFFVNGYNWDCIYSPARVDDLIKRYKAGHVIGSHTWGHVDIAKITPAQLNKQLDLVETALMKILGIKPRFFRPPYGSYNSAALKVLQQRGYTVVNWYFDSGDSVGKSASQSIAAYKKIKTGSPVIALNHEASSRFPSRFSSLRI